MSWTRRWPLILAGVAFIAATTLTTSVRAQVGPSLGVVDANTVAEKDLLTMPHMTPAIVKALIAKRPFMSIVDLNTFLVSQGLTAAQAMEFYPKAFIHVNLNTGTREEILLIPGAGNQMTREFVEYRPWTSFKQFDKEIGKYIGPQATDKLKQYVFIPVDLNKGTDDDFKTIPGATKMVDEFKEYRPWATKAQFDKEIGKYVGPIEAGRLWRYVVIGK